MTETKSRETNKLLVILVSVLLIVTIIQGVFVYKMFQSSQNSEQTSLRTDTALSQNQGATAKGPQHPSAPRTGSGPLSLHSFGLYPDDWDPFRELQRMQEEMNSLFDHSFSRFKGTPWFADTPQEFAFTPRLDLKEDDNHYVVKVDIPGVENPDLSVTIEDRFLNVSGKVDETVEEKDGNRFLRRERRSGHFQRTITLPGPVDAENMKAEYREGVLTVTVPKGEETADSKTITLP